MKHIFGTAAIVAAFSPILAASAPSNVAQVFTATPGQRFSLDLDSKEGVYSAWTHNDLSTLTAFQATMGLMRARTDPKWGAACWVIVKDSDRQTMFQLMLHLTGSSDSVEFVLYPYKDGKRAEGQATGLGGKVGEKFQVEMNWAKPGALGMRINGASRGSALPAPVQTIELAGSTSECAFDPIQFGRISH